MRSVSHGRVYAERRTHDGGAGALGAAYRQRGYLADLLKGGQLNQPIAAVNANELYVETLLLLLADGQNDMHACRFGAVFEHLQGRAVLRHYFDALGALTQHANVRVRADACHYLS